MTSRPLPDKPQPRSSVTTYMSFRACEKYIEQEYDISLMDVAGHRRWHNQLAKIWFEIAVQHELDTARFVSAISTNPLSVITSYFRRHEPDKFLKGQSDEDILAHTRRLLSAIEDALQASKEFREENPEPGHYNYIVYLVDKCELREGDYFYISRTTNEEDWINKMNDIFVNEFAEDGQDEVQFYVEYH